MHEEAWTRYNTYYESKLKSLAERYGSKERTSFFFTSCSTSIGISRTPLFRPLLNGLCDRRGDNDRSIDDGYRGLMQAPLLAVSGSGLNGISTIGLGDRWWLNSLWFCDRNTLWIGHGVFLDIFFCSFYFYSIANPCLNARMNIASIEIEGISQHKTD